MLTGVVIKPPAITYTGPMPGRDSRELLSAMSDLLPSGATVLDLGCGPRDQAIPIQHLGYKYLGVDHSGEAADMIADAHDLPFADSEFDCVFSYAVLEHLHSPFVAIKEIERVLKPGGAFVGTVSQGEPFHDSYFHMTAWGLASLLHSTSLRVSRFWAGPETLTALSSMGRYPQVIKLLLRGVDFIDQAFPSLAPRRKNDELEKLYRAASVCFVAIKPTQVSV